MGLKLDHIFAGIGVGCRKMHGKPLVNRFAVGTQK